MDIAVARACPAVARQTNLNSRDFERRSLKRIRGENFGKFINKKNYPRLNLGAHNFGFSWAATIVLVAVLVSVLFWQPILARQLDEQQPTAVILVLLRMSRRKPWPICRISQWKNQIPISCAIPKLRLLRQLGLEASRCPIRWNRVMPFLALPQI